MKFVVRGQSLEVVGSNIIAEGAVEFASFTLECDASWDGYSRTVRFRHASQDATYDVAGVVDGGVYYIPAEVLARGSVFVSVLGVRSSSRVSTTELAGFFVEGTIDSGKTPSVTENAYAQYVALVNEKAVVSQTAAEDARTSQAQAEQSAISAAASEENSKKSAEFAASFAHECQEVATHVAGAEDSMNVAVERVRDCVDSLLSREHSLSVAESERVGAENVRAANEQKRQTGESAREKAEQERASAEAERVAAERGRVAGEKIRDERVLSLESSLDALSKKLFGCAGAIMGKYESEKIIIDDAENKAPIKFELIGESTQEFAPSKSQPCLIDSVGDDGKIRFVHSGKNFIPFPYTISDGVVNNGVTYTTLADGGILVSGKTEAVKSLVEISSHDLVLDAGHYVVSGGSVGCGVFVYNAEISSYIARSNSGEAEFVLDEPSQIRVRLYVYPQTELCDDLIYPMIRMFSTNADYESHFENTYSVKLSQPLGSVNGISGEYCDTITLGNENSESFIDYQLARYVVDGTESVALVDEACNDEFNVFELTPSEFAEAHNFGDTKHDDMGFCTHFSYGDSLDEESCWVSGEKIFLKLYRNEFADEASVYAFLSKCYAELPLEIVYVRKTPVRVAIDVDFSFEPVKGFNVIETEAGKARLEYIRDTNAVFETIIDTLVNLDARVSLLEV